MILSFLSWHPAWYNNGSSNGEILTAAVVGHVKTPELLLLIILLFPSFTTATISLPPST